MIIVMNSSSTEEQIQKLVDKVESLGLKVHMSKGEERTIIGLIGDEDKVRMQPLERMAGVEKVMPILPPYKLVSREFHKENTVIEIGDVKIGADKVIIMAGPCSVEDKDGLFEVAREIKKAGAAVLRGGAFKPRTSPYSFQGLGEEGLKYLRQAADETGLLVITELMDVRDLDLMQKYTDIIQIGARNMQNYNLLKELGKTDKPVLLKRGMMSTIKEFLMSAEYVLSSGNFNVMLCERGIRTFGSATRFTFDVNAIPVIKRLSHLPVIADPSHGTGKWGLVPPVSKAAVAAGADGLIVEVHQKPEEALSDGVQSLLPENFKDMIVELRKVSKAVNRDV